MRSTVYFHFVLSAAKSAPFALHPRPCFGICELDKSHSSLTRTFLRTKLLARIINQNPSVLLASVCSPFLVVRESVDVTSCPSPLFANPQIAVDVDGLRLLRQRTTNGGKEVKQKITIFASKCSRPHFVGFIYRKTNHPQGSMLEFRLSLWRHSSLNRERPDSTRPNLCTTPLPLLSERYEDEHFVQRAYALGSALSRK
jgi:hypothetical protein